MWRAAVSCAAFFLLAVCPASSSMSNTGISADRHGANPIFLPYELSAQRWASVRLSELLQ